VSSRNWYFSEVLLVLSLPTSLRGGICGGKNHNLPARTNPGICSPAQTPESARPHKSRNLLASTNPSMLKTTLLQ
jgi:hypothetical protein